MSTAKVILDGKEYDFPVVVGSEGADFRQSHYLGAWAPNALVLLLVDQPQPGDRLVWVGDDFLDMWCSALAHCQKRFEGKMSLYKKEERSGGLGCFTPDNFPVFDVFRENVYVIADSNHGYKMIGVGKLVAQELAGEKSMLLEPFRFGRFAKGELHPTSHSPFPWS